MEIYVAQLLHNWNNQTDPFVFSSIGLAQNWLQREFKQDHFTSNGSREYTDGCIRKLLVNSGTTSNKIIYLLSEDKEFNKKINMLATLAETENPFNLKNKYFTSQFENWHQHKY